MSDSIKSIMLSIKYHLEKTEIIVFWFHRQLKTFKLFTHFLNTFLNRHMNQIQMVDQCY